MLMKRHARNLAANNLMLPLGESVIRNGPSFHLSWVQFENVLKPKKPKQ